MKLTDRNVSFEEFMQLWKEFKNKPSEKALEDWILPKKDGERSSLNQRINNEIRRQIFEEVWPENYDFTNISEKEANIFIEFFKITNINEGKLKKLNAIIKTHNLDLKGYDKIWKAFETVND